LLIFADFTEVTNAIIKEFPKASSTHINGFPKSIRKLNEETSEKLATSAVHMGTSIFRKLFYHCNSGFLNPSRIGTDLENTNTNGFQYD
jgi:hypothetical protein